MMNRVIMLKLTWTYMRETYQQTALTDRIKGQWYPTNLIRNQKPHYVSPLSKKSTFNRNWIIPGNKAI